MSEIIVINNEERILQIQVGHAQFGGDCLIQLRPGSNLVDEKRWQQAMALPQVAIWAKTRTSNRDADGKPNMVEVMAGLPALDAPRADRVLRETFDKALLERWYAEERRDDIRVLIQQRRQEIAKIEQQAAAEAAARSGEDVAADPAQQATAPRRAR